ncbi:MAG: hypothetical protein NZ750_03005, partial [Anaerolineae bacterium]|nr:hypothetical protein [Anaerolineae bacterium]MDW8172726.1 hypothetical protein [Anaerolineae bacterium]
LVLGNNIGDRPLLMLGILLLVLGVQFISTGLIADMLMRTYYEAQGKPIYHVREVLHAEDQSTLNRIPPEEGELLASFSTHSSGRKDEDGST